MSLAPGAARRLVVVVAIALRVLLGLAWLHEAWVKYAAHFGGTDIGLVVGSVGSNPRVAAPVAELTRALLGPAPGLWGVLVPAWEAGLGLVLLLGVFPRLAAVAAGVTLAIYWSVDQLIWEYPLMGVLALVCAALSAPRLGAMLRGRRCRASPA